VLIRRLTEDLRSQNWTAVILDLCMVVLGVFIGIQVSNWNEARVERAERVLVELRLQDDFRVLTTELDSAEAYTARVIQSLGVLRHALDRGTVEAAEDEVIRFAIRRGYSHPTFVRHSPTYSELVASGRLDLISDETLRTALARYEEQAQNRLFNLGQLRNIVDRLDLYLPEYATLAPIGEDEDGIQSVVGYDLAGMRADDRFREQLDVLVDVQGWIHSNIFYLQRDIAAVVRTLRETEQ